MKTMVNAFSEYARPAPMHIQAVNLNQLVQDVVELYKSRANPVRYQLDLMPHCRCCRPTPANCVQYCITCCSMPPRAGHYDNPTMEIATRYVDEPNSRFVELHVPTMVRVSRRASWTTCLSRMSRPKTSTGLGLAIVKKSSKSTTARSGQEISRTVAPASPSVCQPVRS